VQVTRISYLVCFLEFFETYPCHLSLITCDKGSTRYISSYFTFPGINKTMKAGSQRILLLLLLLQDYQCSAVNIEKKERGRCVAVMPNGENENNLDAYSENTYRYVSPEEDELMKEKYDNMTDKEWIQKSAEIAGVPQRIDGSADEKEAVRQVIRRMDIYFREEVKANVAYVEANNYGRCANHNDLCSFWASIGECESNRGFMVAKCTAACRLCLLHHLEKNRFTFDAPISAGTAL